MAIAPAEVDTAPRANWPGTLLVWTALALLAVFTQYRSGAFHADFSLDHDEPSHTVSSLMVRDYLTQAFPRNPLTFARDFYSHYPKVAIGHWPPLFYCLEALWMLLAGRSRIALLLFVALCGATLATSLYCVLRKRCSPAIAVFGVAVLMCSPTFQRLLCAVRVDMLLALFVFWAAIFCSRYMFHARYADRNLCAMFTAAAFLVHGRAAVVLLLPFCILLQQKRRLNWKWIASAAVLALLIVVPHVVVPEDHISAASLIRQLLISIGRTILTLEWLPAVPAVIGLVLALRGHRDRPFWTAMAGLVIAGFCFDLLVPAHWDDYLLITSLPALAALVALGTQFLCDKIVASGKAAVRTLHTALACIALLALSLTAYFVAPKRDLGYHRMVASCLLCNAPTALIAADGVNEGALIAESSLADPLRTHTILRGSKALSRSSWSGSRYRPLFHSPAEVARFLDRSHISLVLVQISGSPRLDTQQLHSAVAGNPAWTPVTADQQVQGIEIYRRTTVSSRP